MGWSSRWKRSQTFLKTTAGLMICLLGAARSSQTAALVPNGRTDLPEAEFHLARMIYKTFGGGGSHGYFQPWWAIDYPLADEHFLAALRRMTNMSVAEDSRHLQLTDDRIFDYPFLWMQQPGRGNWNPSPQEVARLREYLLRGGFLFVDDFHGERDWAVFQHGMQLVFPDRPIVDIPDSDPLMHVFFDLNRNTQIPGKRHLRMTRGGDIVAQMDGPPHWRGVYDDSGRLMVAANHNMDIGDSWEHADDPEYPVPMTALGYELGVNYIIYAMTH